MRIYDVMNNAKVEENRKVCAIHILIAEKSKTRFHLEKRLQATLRKYEERVDFFARRFLYLFDTVPEGTAGGEHPHEIKMIHDHVVDIIENIAVDLTNNLQEVVNATRSAWLVLEHTTNINFLRRHVVYWPNEDELGWVVEFNSHLKGWIMLLEAIFDARDDIQTLKSRRYK